MSSPKEFISSDPCFICSHGRKASLDGKVIYLDHDSDELDPFTEVIYDSEKSVVVNLKSQTFSEAKERSASFLKRSLPIILKHTTRVNRMLIQTQLNSTLAAADSEGSSLDVMYPKAEKPYTGASSLIVIGMGPYYPASFPRYAPQSFFAISNLAHVAKYVEENSPLRTAMQRRLLESGYKDSYMVSENGNPEFVPRWIEPF